MIETVISSITNIQQGFQSISIDFNPYYLLKQYLPSIDWEEFSREAKEYKLFKAAQKETNNDGGGGF